VQLCGAGSIVFFGNIQAALDNFELQEKQQEAALIFQGTGVSWAAEVVNPKHPAHAVYTAVKHRVVGVCGGCAYVFGAIEEMIAS
jgi:hypothetical protein